MKVCTLLTQRNNIITIKMILSDKTLQQMISDGSLVCSPLTETSIQSASIDCRLGDEFLIVDSNTQGTISMDQKLDYRKVINESIVIPPKSFILGTTVEYIELPSDIVAFVEGRSSIGRLGLFIQNAGWVDPGFKGQITLELYNANDLPIELQAGKRICQFVFAQLSTDAERPYGDKEKGGKYQSQKGVTGSRVYEDLKID